jgi:hypothetical protein
VKIIVFCLFVALATGGQSTPECLPVTDAEKIADALRAGPNFITDGAIIVDYPASKGGEFRILRKGTSEWTCLPGPPPGSKHDDPGCFDCVFFQWVKDGLAGGPQHSDRLGVAYMYMGQWVPGASGGEFHVGPHIMVVTPHPDDLQGFTRGGCWRLKEHVAEFMRSLGDEAFQSSILPVDRPNRMNGGRRRGTSFK